MFNPQAQVRTVAITPRHACYVVDDAFVDPQHWVNLAVRHRDAFAISADNAFPGPELEFAPEFIEPFARFFDAHIRNALGGRRTTACNARLSLATLAPNQLSPSQSICHTDGRGLAPGIGIGACVAYLFHDPALGGTAFYMPVRAPEEVAAMMQAASSLAPQEFHARYGITRGYLTESNAWFRKVLSIPARWNRLIFYSGTILHSGDIAAPQLLSTDPVRGRLTINGFFQFRRRLSA